MSQPPIPLIQAIQRRAAVVAISPSTVRGQGTSGIVKAVSEFLAVLSLRPFAVSEAGRFRAALDLSTDDLVRTLPGKARSWGLARKCLNIFLHDAYYNSYLVREFGLAQAEPFYEVPLDGVVARELKRRAGRGKLPPWLGVKHLTQPLSDVLQSYAQFCSETMGIARIHLDSYLWVEGR